MKILKQIIFGGVIFGVGYMLGLTKDLILEKRKIVNNFSKLLLGVDAETYFGKKKYYSYRPYFSYSYDPDNRFHSPVNFMFRNKELAQSCVAHAKNIIYTYGYFSVGDLKKWLNKNTNTHYTIVVDDLDLGWCDLSNVRITGGYIDVRDKSKGSAFYIDWPQTENV